MGTNCGGGPNFITDCDFTNSETAFSWPFAAIGGGPSCLFFYRCIMTPQMARMTAKLTGNPAVIEGVSETDEFEEVN